MDGAAVTTDDAAIAVEEARLARAAADGDGNAFAALYEHYEERAFNLAYRISGSEADAADAVREAFLDVARKLPRLVLADGELALGLRLLTATRNACYDAGHGRAGETIAEPAVALGSSDGDPPRQEEVRDASMRLPERQREVLALRDLEELSYDEIVAIMEVGPSAVAQLISRARINLCGELGGTALASVAAPSPACERALPLIATRDDGELEVASGDAAWLDAHLAGCRRCMLAVEAMEEARASYRTWAPIVAPPWLLGETVAKAAGLTGADWSDAIGGREASGDSRRNKRPRRGMALAGALAALLLLAGAAMALRGNDPPAAPATPAASTTAGQDAGARKIDKAKRDAARKRRRRTRTPTAATPVSSPSQIAAGGDIPSESASSPVPVHPAGETAVQPTRQTSASKPDSKPGGTSTSAPISQPSPVPATEEPAPAAEPSTKPSHGHEPPGKPPDRPPR
jgi:RNA polymerase sigma-70 factor (ECF subfamily)